MIVEGKICKQQMVMNNFLLALGIISNAFICPLFDNLAYLTGKDSSALGKPINTDKAHATDIGQPPKMLDNAVYSVILST